MPDIAVADAGLGEDITLTDPGPEDAGSIDAVDAADPSDLNDPGDEGVLELDSGAVDLNVPEGCPLAVIGVQEGEEVLPQTTLHLKGDQSIPGSGTITSYLWSVDQPPENLFGILPSENYPNPQHEVNVVGDYTYCLDVCDGTACSSDAACQTTACRKVTVCGCGYLHIELTWHTPADDDPWDTGPFAGADMDLHFMHPNAEPLDGGPDDGWFDVPWDCFWFNAEPSETDWKVRLDRDDKDGAGPENLNLELEQDADPLTYRIAVHYWKDHGFGVSYPRVKVYLLGNLVFDRDLLALDTPLSQCDLWEVATFQYPDGIVTPVSDRAGGLRILPAFDNTNYLQELGMTCTTE